MQRELNASREGQLRRQQRVEQLSAAATAATDPKQRQDFESVLTGAKLEVEPGEKSAQHWQLREGELSSQLQSEQGKVTELSDRLDQMERSLMVPSESTR